jgi:hypothetical protein
VSEYKFFKNFGKISSSSNFSKNNPKKLSLRFLRNEIDGSLKLYKQFKPSETKPTRGLIFKEPEFHLKLISKKLNKYKKSKVFAFTYKDKSLADLCTTKNNIFYLCKFLKLKFFSNIDFIIFKFFRANIVRKNKIDSLVILRHVWEHVSDHRKLLNKIFNLCDKNSIFYIEVPDSFNQIKSLDYSILWEDHVYYYDKIGFINSLKSSNFEILEFKKFKQDYEDIFCVICKYNKKKKLKLNKSYRMIKYTNSFKDKFETIKMKINKKISQLNKSGEIVFFGASHMLNTYVNIFKLEKYVSYVLDDNKIKQNKFMFKNSIKIFPFSKVLKKFPKFCVLSINPSNKKVINKINVLKANGVKIKNIFKI